MDTSTINTPDSAASVAALEHLQAVQDVITLLKAVIEKRGVEMPTDIMQALLVAP